jgi:hypothetical protein
MKAKWLIKLFVTMVIALLTIACDSSSDDDDKSSSGSVPANAPVSITFTDTDIYGTSQIAGVVTITKATNEGDVTHYVLYWGSGASTKQSTTAITTIAKTGSNLTYTFSDDTSLPSGATHLLAYTKNATGEMATGVSQAITDKMAPVNAAQSVSFTDLDLVGTGDVSGDVTITKAADESDITHYVLYWGDSTTDKQSTTPIADVLADGSNVTHTFSENTSMPSTATHLLVFTKNDDGEMATGVNVAIDDKLSPVNAAQGISFTDTDLDSTGDVSGDVVITKAGNEGDITHYVLYWGDSSTDKQSTTQIAELAKNGGNPIYTFPENTDIPTTPTTATHLLVFTKNDDGEMETGVGIEINDKMAPVHAAQSVSFTDTDIVDAGDVSGDITITAATDESDLTHYVIYWGNSSTTKLNTTPIADVSKNSGNNITHTLAENTDMTSATHFLVFTKNNDGEMSTGVSVAIDDKIAPANAADSISFTDTDWITAGQIGGDVSIDVADDETYITHYALYWGDSTSDKLSETAIANITADTANKTYTFDAGTDIPTGATHLLLFSNNADGEMPTGVNTEITDLYSKLPHTGHTDCYDHEGTSIACPATDEAYAQDGTYLNNPQSFTDNSDDTITDNNTLLMWQKEDDNVQYTWADATVDCADSTSDGYTDWRLPTVKELTTILNFKEVSPSIDPIFTNTNTTSYWTSTVLASNSDNAWYVSFDAGNYFNSAKTNIYYVRCVRSTYSTDFWPDDFVDNGDGTVTHTGTGLMWQKEDDDTTPDWTTAISNCEAESTLGGYSDWRLPNINELQTIVDYADDTTPLINSTYFPNTDSAFYWTSTSAANDGSPEEAYGINFDNGYTVLRGKDGSTYNYRCVRTVQ